MLKSTADVNGGRALYDGYSTVDDSGAHNFLRLRETVLLRKEERKMFVQANSRISGTYLHRCVHVAVHAFKLLFPRTKSFLAVCLSLRGHCGAGGVRKQRGRFDPLLHGALPGRRGAARGRPVGDEPKGRPLLVLIEVFELYNVEAD